MITNNKDLLRYLRENYAMLDWKMTREDTSSPEIVAKYKDYELVARVNGDGLVIGVNTTKFPYTTYGDTCASMDEFNRLIKLALDKLGIKGIAVQTTLFEML